MMKVLQTVLYIMMFLTVVLLSRPALAANVSDASGNQVVSAEGTPVTSTGSETRGGHTGSLAVFMLLGAVAASPLTLGGSFYLTAIAWPAVIGAAAMGVQGVVTK